MTTQQRLTVYQAFLALLEDAIAQAGSAYQLANHLGLAPNVITRWRNRERVPSLNSIQPIVDYVGKGFSIEPTTEEIEARLKTVTDAKSLAEALSKDNERLKTEVATLRGEIAALERQLDRQLNHLAPRPERGRRFDPSSTSSRRAEEETDQSRLA